MYYTSLRYFLIAAEELNITRAAERLHLTQQALSTHITKLEAEYRTTFFERKKSGLALTAEGRRFYEFAASARKLEERMKSTGHVGSDGELAEHLGDIIQEGDADDWEYEVFNIEKV